jgi:hypothetical protein
MTIDGLVSTYKCFKQVSQHVGHHAYCALVHLNVLREDVDNFQKICQVGLGMIQGMNCYLGTKYLTHLEDVLNIANTYDFYEAMQLPRRAFYRITAASIDEEQLLNDLCAKASYENSLQRPLLQKSVESFLEHVEKEDIAYRNVHQFKRDLLHWLKRDAQLRFFYSAEDVLALPIALKKPSSVEVLAEISFSAAKLAYIPSFLQAWNVVDLSPVSHALGKHRFSRIFTSMLLDQWISAALCMGFALQTLQAVRILCQGESTSNEKAMARWDAAQGGAECIFNYLAFRAVPQAAPTPQLILAMVIAKSLGPIRSLCRPASDFFETPSG